MKKEKMNELDCEHSDVVRCVEQYSPEQLRESVLQFLTAIPKYLDNLDNLTYTVDSLTGSRSRRASK